MFDRLTLEVELKVRQFQLKTLLKRCRYASDWRQDCSYIFYDLTIPNWKKTILDKIIFLSVSQRMCQLSSVEQEWRVSIYQGKSQELNSLAGCLFTAGCFFIYTNLCTVCRLLASGSDDTNIVIWRPGSHVNEVHKIPTLHRNNIFSVKVKHIYRSNFHAAYYNMLTLHCKRWSRDLLLINCI